MAKAAGMPLRLISQAPSAGPATLETWLLKLVRALALVRLSRGTSSGITEYRPAGRKPLRTKAMLAK